MFEIVKSEEGRKRIGAVHPNHSYLLQRENLVVVQNKLASQNEKGILS
jgi:hypothetical protein